MGDFRKALRNNPSKCLDCDEFRWCPYKAWIGKPEKCLESKSPEQQAQKST